MRNWAHTGEQLFRAIGSYGCSNKQASGGLVGLLKGTSKVEEGNHTFFLLVGETNWPPSVPKFLFWFLSNDCLPPALKVLILIWRRCVKSPAAKSFLGFLLFVDLWTLLECYRNLTGWQWLFQSDPLVLQGRLVTARVGNSLNIINSLLIPIPLTNSASNQFLVRSEMIKKSEV